MKKIIMILIFLFGSSYYFGINYKTEIKEILNPLVSSELTFSQKINQVNENFLGKFNGTKDTLSKTIEEIDVVAHKKRILKLLETENNGNKTNQSFSKAKKELEKIYNDNSLKRIDQYCGCTYDSNKNINLKSCGFISSGKYKNRTNKIEWEHIVPVENFGQSFTEWRKGDDKCIDSKGQSFKGRNCASKTNLDFRYMESDMYNLIPVIGELNALRSNKSYEELSKSDYSFGKCNAKVSPTKFMPQVQSKGLVARASLYMESTYTKHYKLSDKMFKLFKAWDKMYPVTSEECKRYKEIKKIQKNENVILKERCN